jgi:endoglucanase
LLAAHLDEVGLLITKVEADGFLRFTPVGGLDPRVLVAQEVVVHGRRPLVGIIGARPPHIQTPEESRQAYPLERLYIDVGLEGPAAREAVRVGDPVTMAARFVRLAGGRVAGKALDDRAGVVTMLACLADLAARRHLADVYAVATVGEETTGRGAFAAAYALEPQVAVAIDVNFAEDQPDRTATRLGRGPGLVAGPVAHPGLFRHFEAAARETGLPFQVDADPSPKGTDAYVLQVARAGAPTMLVDVPLLNMHTPVEVACLADLAATGSLLAEAIARLDWARLEELRCF